MKRVNLKNGVTLISLIITIVLVLIITFVAVGTVKNTRLIEITEDTESDYILAEEKQKIKTAYSKFETERLINPQTSLESLKIEGATVETIGTVGWKINYLNTGNTYTMNKDGKEDEAIKIIIKTVDELKRDGADVEVSDFIIYEDRVAKLQNSTKTNELEKAPEKYIFYNWATVDVNDIDKLEQRVIMSQPENKLICDMSNRAFMIDFDGNGITNQNDYEVFEKMRLYVSSYEVMMNWDSNILYNFEINQIYAKYSAQDEWTIEYYPAIFTQDFYAQLMAYEEETISMAICKDNELENFQTLQYYISLYPYYNLRSN